MRSSSGLSDRISNPRRRSGANWRLVAQALQHRNYRLFYGGQGISLIGTWMTRVATGWLVYRLTHSAFLLGVVSFAGHIPILLLGPVAGVWVDRLNRHRRLARSAVHSAPVYLSSYSVLSALAGSIEAARRAGINPARDAASAKVRTDPKSTVTSTPFTSYNCA